jgi:hypothetical protein
MSVSNKIPEVFFKFLKHAKAILQTFTISRKKTLIL